MNNHQLTETGSKIASHLLAVVAGVIMILIGLLLSVPMVGLPLGIPIGLAGVLICLWGLFGTSPQRAIEPLTTDHWPLFIHSHAGHCLLQLVNGLRRNLRADEVE